MGVPNFVDGMDTSGMDPGGQFSNFMNPGGNNHPMFNNNNDANNGASITPGGIRVASDLMATSSLSEQLAFQQQQQHHQHHQPRIKPEGDQPSVTTPQPYPLNQASMQGSYVTSPLGVGVGEGMVLGAGQGQQQVVRGQMPGRRLARPGMTRPFTRGGGKSN